MAILKKPNFIYPENMAKFIFDVARDCPILLASIFPPHDTKTL